MPAGWLKTSKSRPRAMPTSVIPQASAVRIASAVGAETAMMMPAPMAAVFWTISTDTRLVSTTAPERPENAQAGQRAGKLVEGVMPPDVFAHDHGLAAWYEESGCVGGSRLMVEPLRRSQRLDG